MEGKWLSVLEYAAYKKKSISTVRRYIKANRVKHKEESGKYFIFVKNFSENPNNFEKENLELKFENKRLSREVLLLKEELSEMKMLINIYEETPNIPELPSGI